MKQETVSKAIDLIDPNYIDEADAFAADGLAESASRPDSRAKRARRIRWGAVAACLALVVALGGTALAFHAEAKEYQAAVAFFEENGLSMEGLSRAEVKEVYRDITTKRFASGKTAEVLRNSIPGWELRQDEPTPEELAAVWDRKVWYEPITMSGISYRKDFHYVRDETAGFEVLESSSLECYRDGALAWTASFTDFYVSDYAEQPDSVAVWGQNETRSSEDVTRGWLARVDREGKILWQRPLLHGFKDEYIADVLDNEDGSWAVVSRGNLNTLCLSILDSETGKEIESHQSEIGNLGIQNATRLGNDYLIQVGNYIERDTALLYRVDRAGNVIASYSYEAEDCDYYIQDMTVFGGRVYLSAYAVPKQTDEGGRHEIANILDYVLFGHTSSDGTMGEIPSEALTPVVRNNYTAVLLLCDLEGGTPQTFYSVKGSLGGRLAVNAAGALEWDVESITSTFFSPATSSFSIGGTCKLFRYSFDQNGQLIMSTDTGDTVPYRR